MMGFTKGGDFFPVYFLQSQLLLPNVEVLIILQHEAADQRNNTDEKRVSRYVPTLKSADYFSDADYGRCPIPPSRVKVSPLMNLKSGLAS